ncbi:MAG: replication-associated recombination protein A [Thermoanaerobaculia bacterium]
MRRTLFEEPGREEATGVGAAPLADRMRPRSLDEVLGQEGVVGAEGFLRRAIADDRVPSMVFWGPPGSGKTTLARIIADSTRARFVPFSAVTSGIKEVKAVMVDAERWQKAQGGRTLLFVDEIHRFNRAQQDAFLPYVETGAITLVGATTENPSFELNGALLSRLRVVVLQPLSSDDLVAIQRQALEDAERGLGNEALEVEPEAVGAVAALADGDARRALNLLEALAADARSEGRSRITAATVREVAQRKTLLYDKSGEEHYNLISALHKSLRESDADAALYWLERMLMAGEDPHYVARRLVRFASEDVGLADPQALPMTLAAWEAYDRLGSPEGELALAESALYLALAPKSVAVYAASEAARRTIEERPADPVPPVIRNAVTRLMRDVGYGKGYIYAPETEEGVGGIDCLPEALQGTRFYEPRGAGFETELRARRQQLDALRQKLRSRS